MRRPLRYQYPPAPLRAASDTWLAGTLVDAMTELEKALVQPGAYVVGNGRSAGFDGFREHLHNGAMQAARTLAANLRRGCLRVNPCAEQRFVGIDVADAAQEPGSAIAP